MKYIYSHSNVMCAHELISICGISITFQGHICCLHIYGCSMENKSCIVFFHLYVL